MLRGFYAICDVGRIEATKESLAKVQKQARELLDATPCMLQLRAKHASPHALWQLALAIRPLCTEARVPFCVNDRLDIALAVSADAVHLGQDDLPLLAAKAVLRSRPPMLIGISTHNQEQATAAVAAGADYIGFGPLFATRTKQNADPVVGLSQLSAAVVQAGGVPVVGIGGITLQTVQAVADTGAAAAAVISAVANHANPAYAGALVNRAFGVGAGSAL